MTEHLDNVTNIKLAAKRIIQYGYVDFRGKLVTKANVQEYQGAVTLTKVRKHLSEIFNGY